MPVLTFDVVTIFPGFFQGPLTHGIVSQAHRKEKVEIHIHDLRDFTEDRHKTVDDRPFGGGEGMVLKPEPIFRSVESIYAASNFSRKRVILLSPQGRRFNQSVAFELSALQQVTLICGRYEGVDERVARFLATEEISVGDYVLSGGELAACVVIDAVSRLVPGVLNKTSSTLNESFAALSSPSSTADPIDSVLDCPQYTRPENFRGLRVPEILLSGDHRKVSLWRRRKALEKTLKNRPDLLKYERLTEADRQVLISQELEQ